MTTQNQLYIYKDTWIYMGQSMTKKVHQHHALQLFLCPKSPLHIDINGSRVTSHAGFINSDVPHQCLKAGIDLIFINIETESQLGLNLKVKFLDKNPFYHLPEQQYLQLQRLCSHPDFNYTPQRLLQELSNTKFHPIIDARITETITYMDQHIIDPLDTSVLSNLCCLSESRFLHLFKEQVGIPARKYIQWLRIRKAIDLIASGSSLSNAAYSTGFTDASHFNRIFSRMFGVSPSTFLENSSFVQVHSFYEV